MSWFSKRKPREVTADEARRRLGLDRPDWLASVIGTVFALHMEVRGFAPREEDQMLVAECLLIAFNGGDGNAIRKYLRSRWPEPTPAPVPVPPPVPPATAPMRVLAQRDVFRTADGAIFRKQEWTSFLHFHTWLMGGDIEPTVAAARRRKANTLRVLGMVHWPDVTFGPSYPGYFDRLVAYFAAMRDRGLRVNFCAFASAQDIMPREDEQRAHLQHVHDLAASFDNVFLQVCNEPFQNGVKPINLWPRSKPRGVPMDYGDYDPEKPANETAPDARSTLAVLDFCDPHLRRDAAWMRAAKDLLEYRDGGVTVPPLDGLHVPISSGEPMGAHSVDVPGRRDANWRHHAWHHGVAALFGAGSTFHFESGLRGNPPVPGPEDDCAAAVGEVWSFIPPDVQLWQYTRSGLPDCPIDFDPALFPEETSRIYGRIAGNVAYVVAVCPTPLDRFTATARNGWRIDAQIAEGTILRLVR